MAEVLTEKEINELLAWKPIRRWYIYDKKSKERPNINNMTFEEIKMLLEQSEYVKGIKDDDIIYSFKLGLFYNDYKNEFSFVGYPFTSENSEIEYDYAFEIFVDKKTGEISCADSPIDPVELRRIEKENGINNIKPYEDTVKTINDARSVLEKCKLILGEKKYGKEYEGIIYYYKLGAFYCEYEDMFSFIGYPYTSKDVEVNYENPNELFVEKWRGKVAIAGKIFSKTKMENEIELSIEFIDKEYDSVRYGCIKKLKIIKYNELNK
jgi:hypothetical protein